MLHCSSKDKRKKRRIKRLGKLERCNQESRRGALESPRTYRLVSVKYPLLMRGEALQWI
jgi:hypothetical protein